MVSVYRTVLGRPDLADHDDFFAAGGDSLRATAAVLELAERHRVSVGVSDLIARPTANAMGDLIARRAMDVERVPTTAELIAADLVSLTTVRRSSCAPRTTSRSNRTVAVSTVIPGMRRPEHVRANLGVAGSSVSPDLRRALRAHRWDRVPTSWSM